MKAFFISLLMSTGLALMPIVPLMVVIGIIVFAHLVVSLWKIQRRAVKKSRKRISRCQLFISHLRRMCLFQFTIATIFALDRLALNDLGHLLVSFDFLVTKAVCILITAFEFYSIDSIIHSVTGKSFLGAVEKVAGVAKTAKSKAYGIFYNDTK